MTLLYALVRVARGTAWVIVLHAVMTYERSIGTREAGSGKFRIIYGSAGLNRGAPARQWSSKFEKGGSAGKIRGFDPRVNRKQLAGHDGLTRE